MQRVTQMKMYRFGSISRLRIIAVGDERLSWKFRLEQIQITVRAFAATDNNKELLPNAWERAQGLQDTIRRIRTDPDERLSQVEIDWMIRELNAFETSLEDDLGRLPTYIIDAELGINSIDKLINDADDAFSQSIKLQMPDSAIEDFRHAGACLAFDLPTACGFHVFRATDAMIRTYYAHFLHTVPKTKPRDWGAYIRALRVVLADPVAPKKPNERTINFLDSIRAMDRNPVIHPELDLDSEMALAAFDMCKNVIVFMAMDIIATP